MCKASELTYAGPIEGRGAPQPRDALATASSVRTERLSIFHKARVMWSTSIAEPPYPGGSGQPLIIPSTFATNLARSHGLVGTLLPGCVGELPPVTSLSKACASLSPRAD